MAVIEPLIRELRARGVAVGVQEAVSLAGALARGLHESSFEQFYLVARSLLIHDESDLDEFDAVFSHVFKDIPYAAQKITDELREWLKNPVARPELTDEERAALKELDPEELRRMFEERLREQTERHDGGSHWIGTGGTSPFGTGGYHPSGMSLREGSPGGARSMLRSANARAYRQYRHDLVLDVRQLEVALRRLRTFEHDGARTELDLERTVDETARNFGELEVVMRRPRRPNTRVILMMDTGGSMEPYAALVSQLFSAAKRATHWKELRTYAFHNCVYGRVWKTGEDYEPVSVKDLFRECDERYKLIFVGDASMAPYELAIEQGFEWLVKLRKHFPRSIWLNPELSSSWRGSTADTIASVFPMFPLTVEGLEEGLKSIRAGS